MQIIKVDFQNRRLLNIHEKDFSFIQEQFDCSKYIERAFFSKEQGTLIICYRRNHRYFRFESVSWELYCNIFRKGSVGRNFTKYKKQLGLGVELLPKEVQELVA